MLSFFFFTTSLLDIMHFMFSKDFEVKRLYKITLLLYDQSRPEADL